MARGIDLSALTRAERVVLVAGIAGFLNGFVPWWYRVETSSKTFSYNAGLTGWSSIAVALCLLAALAAIARATAWPRSAPRWDAAAYMLLGAIAFDSIAAQANAQAGHQWIGLYVALLCALGLVAGGFLRKRERRKGWL